MKPAKPSLKDGLVTVSVKRRVTADGKTIRQKSFVRASKNPTSAPAPTPPKPPEPAEPPAPPPAAAAAAPPAPPAPPAPVAADPTTATAPATAPPPAPPPFTPAQDTQLLDLKRTNTPWKQISLLMDGKPVSQLRDRFKELMTQSQAQAAAVTGSGAEKEKEKTDEEKKKDEQAEKKKAAAEEKRKAGEERKRAWEEKKRVEKEEADKKVAEAEAEKEKEKEKAGGGGGGEAKAAEVKEEKKFVFFDDGRFTLDEIVLVHKLAERYENRKWLEVASKFFDTTGKRVHPDEMRDALSGAGK